MGDGLIDVSSIFIIGNAFGYSALVLAFIYPSAVIDTIDPNPRHNDLLSNITVSQGLNMTFYAGESPKDLYRAMRMKKYDLIFIDGDHDDEAVEADFMGIHARASESAVIVLHDALMLSKGAVRAIMNSPGHQFCSSVYPAS